MGSNKSQYPAGWDLYTFCSIQDGTSALQRSPYPGVTGLWLTKAPFFTPCNKNSVYQVTGKIAVASEEDKASPSGKEWVAWANEHAQNSSNLDDLESTFKQKAKAFIQALENAGAQVNVLVTRRSDKRAYLFHWSWLIALGKAQPNEPAKRNDVPIIWDHGNTANSKNGAQEMVDGFELAVPPKSTNAPALNSKHISGKAIDLKITWKGKITVKKKDGTQMDIGMQTTANGNVKLQEVGASYGVIKLKTDEPHWSDNGH